MKRPRCSLGRWVRDRDRGSLLTRNSSIGSGRRNRRRDPLLTRNSSIESGAAGAARLRLLPRKTFGGGPDGGSSLSLLGGVIAAGVALVAVALAGCGEAGGIAEGATVSVYAASPSCAGAGRALRRHGERDGEARVRLVCVSDGEHGRAWTLAAVGANARRASEDSTTVAYIADRNPTAAEFSRSILEEAGITQLQGQPGAVAMHQLLTTIEDAGSSSNLRQSVNKSLGND